MTEQKLNKLEQQIIKLLELANKNTNQAEAIHRMADSYQTKIWKQGNGVKGVYNRVGLKKELDKNCTALKITVAEEVNTEFDKFMAEKGAGTFITKKRNAPVDTCAFLQGVAEGSTIMQRKQVEAK